MTRDRIAFTHDDRLVILELWGCRCAYCGVRLAQGDDDCDHVMPWSRGGAHALANVASSCAACNRSKGAQSAADIGRPDVGVAAVALALLVADALERESPFVLGVELEVVRLSRMVRVGWVSAGPSRFD